MRYSLRTLLLGVTFVGISVGGVIANWKANHAESLNALHQAAAIVSEAPYWIPMIFGAYAVGRRELTIPCVCFFAFVEVAAIGVVIGLYEAFTP